MSSRKAVYESSILCCGFWTDDDELVDSCFATTGAAAGRVVVGTADDVFGLAFGTTLSLLTRTDAGTIDVSSGVC